YVSVFFFSSRRRHTRLVSDWSSDVCSSDLGEPAIALEDLMQTDRGRGVVSILAADKLLASPRVYSTVLLWLLSELFEHLPEVGEIGRASCRERVRKRVWAFVRRTK